MGMCSILQLICPSKNQFQLNFKILKKCKFVQMFDISLTVARQLGSTLKKMFQYLYDRNQ